MKNILKPISAFYSKHVKTSLTLIPSLLFFSFVIAQPKINSFTPASGAVGTTVTINGINFDPSPANNIVSFGAVKATVLTASVNMLTVTVPAGATFEPITVTSGNLTGYSNLPFVATFSGSDTITSALFAKQLELTAGSSPIEVVASDFDGDGKPDLAAINYYSSSVSIKRNSGSGGNAAFIAAADLITGTNPYGVSVGDIDSDGKPDLAVISSSLISIFINTSSPGNISFTTKTDFATTSSYGAICINDLDGDGKPDIAILSQSSGWVNIYRNQSTQGSPAFAAPYSVASPASGYAIASGDLDGDGKPELVAPSYSGEVFVVFKNASTVGNMSFGNRTNHLIESNHQTLDISVTDFDGDGKLDVGLLNAGLQKIAVMRNTSANGFLSLGIPKDFTTISGAAALTANDINGDGKVDIMVAGTNALSVLKNIGTPGSVDFVTKVDYASTQLTALVTADFDGDEETDIIATANPNKILFFKNKVNDLSITSVQGNDGCIVAGSTVTIRGFNLTGATGVSLDGIPVSSFSIDSDKSITAVAAAASNLNASITTVNGTYSFTVPAPVLSGFTPLHPAPGTTMILKGKNLCGTTRVRAGNIDMPFTATSDSTISVELTSAVSGVIGVFTARGVVSIGFYNGPAITSISALSAIAGSTVIISGTNFNPSPAANHVYFGGVRAEVSVAGNTSLSVIVPEGATDNYISVTANGLTAYSQQPFVITFKGAIKLNQESFAPKFDLPSASGPVKSTVAEMDGDGKPDLIVANYESMNVTIYRNTSGRGLIGGTSFAPGVVLAQAGNPVNVTAGDVTGDGKLDLIVSNRGSGVDVYINNSSNGVISFDRARRIENLPKPFKSVIHDLDLDGRPDIILSNESSPDIRIEFRLQLSNDSLHMDNRSVTTAQLMENISVADFNSDGLPDIIGNSKFNDSVTILKNSSISFLNFAPPVYYSGSLVPGNMATADIDGDGKPDIIFTGFSTSNISIMRNLSSTTNISVAAIFSWASDAGPVDLSITDIDGDGKRDIITANETAGTISIFKNVSTAGVINLSSLQAKQSFTAGTKPAHVAIADIDTDGKPDIIVANQLSNNISLFRNKIAEAKLVASGANPITGSVMQKVTIDATVQRHNGNPYVQRHYDIEPEENAATATATVTLFYTQAEFNNYNATPGHGLNLPGFSTDAAGKSNLRVYQFHGFSTSGMPGTYSGEGVEINPDDTKIVWNATAGWWEVTFDVNGFSGFFVGTAGTSILPLHLLTFSGSMQDAGAELLWSTSDEINVSHYLIQRSHDASNYMAIGKVYAYGNPNRPNSYRYTDLTAAEGNYYYRLKMVDKDSSFTYSKVISLGSAASGSSLRLYPNPVNGLVTVKHPSANKAVIEVVDIAGRKLRSVDVQKNAIQTKLDLSGLPAGHYTLRFSDGNNRLLQNVMLR